VGGRIRSTENLIIYLVCNSSLSILSVTSPINYSSAIPFLFCLKKIKLSLCFISETLLYFIRIAGGGWSPTGFTRHVGHQLAYCTCRGWLRGWKIWWNDDWQGDRSSQRKLTQFLNPMTVAGTPWKVDQHVVRPLPIQTRNKHTQISMPWVGCESTIPAFDRANQFYTKPIIIYSLIHLFIWRSWESIRFFK
jgi:hypothetical protein